MAPEANTIRLWTGSSPDAFNQQASPSNASNSKVGTRGDLMAGPLRRTRAVPRIGLYSGPS